jgi:hypothetical protein
MSERPEVLPYHVRVGLVLKGTGFQQMSAREDAIHTAFERLTKEHPDLLPELDFVTLSYYPYSHELQAALVLLQNDGFLSADNPRWEFLRLDEKRSKDVEAGALKRAPEVTRSLLRLGQENKERFATEIR